MIAKVPEKRGDKRSSFRTLRDYIALREQVNRETGEVEMVAVPTETNCLSLATASAEMRAAAAMNTRVKDPVYHVVLSWQAGETPTDAQMFEATREAMAAVGMAGHQYVAAIHRDTDNPHVHLMVNRVHPETYRAVYPDRDFYKLDRCMRELELKHGWAHSRGPYAVFERDGKKVIDWASSDSKNTKERMPSSARDLEEAIGQESFYTFARKARPAVAALLKKDAATWSELHAILGKNGLELREKGQGFGIYNLKDAEQTPIKASDLHELLGRKKLESRLGAYQAPEVAPAVVWSYDKKAKPQRDPASREAARLERKSARTALLEQYRTAKAGHAEQHAAELAKATERYRQELAALASWSKRGRQDIREKVADKDLRQVAYGLRLVQLKQAKEEARANLVKAKQAARFVGKNEWIGELATQGDRAAIAYVRGLYYAEQRRQKAMAEEEAENSIRPVGRDDDEPLARPFSQLTWNVDLKTGVVAYHCAGKEAFVDRGQRIDFARAELNDVAILAALELAREKYGRTLDLKGSPEFCARVVALAARQNLAVQFRDPTQEARRQALRHELTQPRPVPAPMHEVPPSVAQVETAATQPVLPKVVKPYRKDVEAILKNPAPLPIPAKSRKKVPTQLVGSDEERERQAALLAAAHREPVAQLPGPAVTLEEFVAGLPQGAPVSQAREGVHIFGTALSVDELASGQTVAVFNMGRERIVTPVEPGAVVAGAKYQGRVEGGKFAGKPVQTRDRGGRGR